MPSCTNNDPRPPSGTTFALRAFAYATRAGAVGRAGTRSTGAVTEKSYCWGRLDRGNWEVRKRQQNNNLRRLETSPSKPLRVTDGSPQQASLGSIRRGIPRLACSFMAVAKLNM